MSGTGSEVVSEAPGMALAAARRANNLSVADVARQLKLSVNQIEALEAGAFEKLPGPVFVRGFIRNYARLLKLDPEAVLRWVNPGVPSPVVSSLEASPQREIPFPRAAARRWPAYMMATLLLIGGLAAYEFYWSEPGFTVLKNPPAAEITAASPVPATPELPVPAAAEPAPVTGGPAEPAPAASAEPAVTRETSAAGDNNQAQPPQATTPAAGEAAASGEYSLQFVFGEKSWVEVRDGSGKVIFSQLNQRGSKKQIYGKPPFSLVIGNAHGVQLTYNDKPVDLEPHIKVDVARFTLE